MNGRIVLLAGIVLLAAACGGTGSAPPASSIYMQSLAYAGCLHARSGQALFDQSLNGMGVHLKGRLWLD